MPTKLFRISIYDVAFDHAGNEAQTTFQMAIDQTLAHLQRVDREKNAGSRLRRLDFHERRGNLYLLNFITFEYEGNGRVRRGQPVMPIAMNRDESFSAETAMLYDPDTGLAFLESSQGSMGAGTVARYFEEFANQGSTYTLVPRVDDNAAARARRKQIVRSLEMQVSMGPTTAQDRAAGTDMAKNIGNRFGADYTNFELKVGRRRDRSLDRGVVGEMVDIFFGITGGNRDIPGITRLRISGREHDNDPIEIIDLIQHREKRQIMLQIDDVSRKVPYRIRWDALANAHRLFFQQ